MTNIPDILQAALAQHRAGCHREASELYWRVLDTDPQNADTLHLLGMLALDRRQYDESAASIRRAIRVNHTRARPVFVTAANTPASSPTAFVSPSQSP